MGNLSFEAIDAYYNYKEGKISKKDLNKELDKASQEKRKKCLNKDGSFNYLKMSEMYHNGEW